MIIYIIIGFLAISLVCYCIFGGADFGAGILSIFTERTDGNDLSEVIGPVWEANHVWLILAVTILFVGFPKVYSTITLYLHIPILLLLIGIILRGTAFAFIHYDAIRDQSTTVYQWVFKLSSVMTPFLLGTTAGALMLGDIDPVGTSFYEVFVASWFNAFAFSVGLFCTILFAFMASIFIIGDVDREEDRTMITRYAKFLQVSVVLSGGIVFFCAWFYNASLFDLFLNSWVALGCIAIATLSLGLIWQVLNRKNIWLLRIIAGGQMALILFAWFWIQHPVVVNLQGEDDITFYNGVAPESTLIQLLIALIVGSCLILPSLFILFRTFKSEDRTLAD